MFLRNVGRLSADYTALYISEDMAIQVLLCISAILNLIIKCQAVIRTQRRDKTHRQIGAGTFSVVLCLQHYQFNGSQATRGYRTEIVFNCLQEPQGLHEEVIETVMRR
jgi:hypothetical protein